MQRLLVVVAFAVGIALGAAGRRIAPKVIELVSAWQSSEPGSTTNRSPAAALPTP
jgi:hypothetical protein